MRRVLLACTLALVANVPEVAARDCQELRRVLPADGAMDVPTNASVWIFGEDQNAYVIDDGTAERIVGHAVWSTPRIQRLDLGLLASRHAYTVRTIGGEHVTAFTTGDDVDVSRPSPPILKHVGSESGRLSVAAESGGIAVWVRAWRRSDAHVPWAWQLFPADGFDSAFDTCNQIDRHSPGSECVELRAMDLEGHTSASVSNCTPPPADPFVAKPKRPHGRRGFIAWLLFGVGALAGAWMVGVRRRSTDLIAR
jgi:hypothetical protein